MYCKNYYVMRTLGKMSGARVTLCPHTLHGTVQRTELRTRPCFEGLIIQFLTTRNNRGELERGHRENCSESVKVCNQTVSHLQLLLLYSRILWDTKHLVAPYLCCKPVLIWGQCNSGLLPKNSRNCSLKNVPSKQTNKPTYCSQGSLRCRND